MIDSLVVLDRAARRRITKLDRRTRDAHVRIRCRVLLKVSRGASRLAAARELGCAPSTAWWIVRRFERRGEASVFDGRSENGERKVDEDVHGALREILMKRPPDFGYARSSWSLEVLALVLAEKAGVRLSIGHLWKVLRSLGVRWGRPRPVVSCPWKTARRERRLARLRRLAENPPSREVVLYSDEVDIDLNPRIGPDWMLPGTQRLVMTPGKNQKRYIAGAHDPRAETMVYVEGKRKVSWLFVDLLRALARFYRNARRIHLILDNYGIHKSRVVQTVLRSLTKIRLHFLPPYCSNENKIERQWLDLHANVTRNHRCRTIAELLRAVRHWMNSRYHAHRGLSYAT
jgi:transposase